MLFLFISLPSLPLYSSLYVFSSYFSFVFLFFYEFVIFLSSSLASAFLISQLYFFHISVLSLFLLHGFFYLYPLPFHSYAFPSVLMTSFPYRSPSPLFPCPIFCLYSLFYCFCALDFLLHAFFFPLVLLSLLLSFLSLPYSCHPFLSSPSLKYQLLSHPFQCSCILDFLLCLFSYPLPLQLFPFP